MTKKEVELIVKQLSPSIQNKFQEALPEMKKYANSLGGDEDLAWSMSLNSVRAMLKWFINYANTHKVTDDITILQKDLELLESIDIK